MEQRSEPQRKAKLADSGVEFERAVPILHVRDLIVSLEYYVRVLGFETGFSEPGIIASVARGGCELYLVEGDQGREGTWVWIGVGDADALYDELRMRGATIRIPPTDYPWAREFQVTDPDGHVLRFGSEPREDAATGEWLDMRGERWAKSREGGWKRAGHE